MNRKCATKYCRKKAAAKSTKCHSCIKKAYAERHPVRYAFNNLKQNAKRRGKSFELTFEQFEQFAVSTAYMVGKGITKDSLHIDRIDPERGYSIDNIRVLTNSENVQRHQKYLKYEIGPDGKPSFRVDDDSGSNSTGAGSSSAPF